MEQLFDPSLHAVYSRNLSSAYDDWLHNNIPNLKKEHTERTSTRVVKALLELTSGYAINPANILSTSFSAGKYNQMITVGNIKFTSLCSHHMLPFFGKVHFAYIPNRRIVGISKIPRIVEAFARRLQVQEDLTEEIATCFQTTVKPKGCAVLIEAQHLCMAIRGVKKEEAYMRTTALRGLFIKDESAKAEFLASVRR